MNHRISIVTAAVVLGLAFLSPMRATSANALPANWFLRGQHSDAYVASVENGALQLSCAVQNSGFGTAMQTIAPTHYAGRTYAFPPTCDRMALWGGPAFGCGSMAKPENNWLLTICSGAR